ncbi:unnamed protein product, partial [Coregonus sp. 'balchen']
MSPFLNVFLFGPVLPPASLRLLVPPLRLVSAALWQVVQRRDVMDYGLVEEFVTTTCCVGHSPRSDEFQRESPTHHGSESTEQDEDLYHHSFLILRWRHQNPNFLKLIQTRLEDPVFLEEFGPKYHSALQTLTASWFLPDPSVLEECVQTGRLCHPQPLRTLLQSHTNPSPVPHQSFSSPTPILLRSHTNPSPVRHQPFSGPTPTLLRSHTNPSPVPHQSFSSTTPTLLRSHTNPSPVPHQPFSSPTPTLLRSHTNPSPVPHQPFSSPTPTLLQSHMLRPM